MLRSGSLRVALDVTPLIGHRTGVGEFCRGAVGALSARDDVEVDGYVVSWRRRDWARDALPPKVRTEQRPMPARPLHWSWRHAAVPPAEWFVGRQDVVHGTNFVVPPTRHAARVVTVHDLTALRYPEMCDRPTLAYPDLIRRALRSGAFVHTPSFFVAAEVVDAFGVDPGRVRAVHSGIPVRQTVAGTDAAAAVLPPGAQRYVLSLATAEPRKDLAGLVAAFDQLAAQRDDLWLVLAGPPGWGEHQLQSVLDRAAHRARIVRTGWVDDATVAALLERATVLAYPSLYEGFGFPALEAMVRGVPVVATDAGALPEVLGDGAVLVAAGDPNALAEGLAVVLDSPARAAALAAAGRRRSQAFNWVACADGLAALYRDAVSARRG
jgi:glycosyltransferase involved in cell wall biosynthesis